MKKLLWGMMLVLLALTGIVYAEDKPQTVIIFDASGSMWGQIDGKTKIEIAREALGKVINEWSTDVELGLTVYGHRKKGDCNDIQTLIPVGKVDKSRVISTVKSIQPKGKTPISRSLKKVADEIKFTEEKATIILISDGKETCDADPCATAKELENQGIDFVTHVIGFNVDKKTDKQLECIAYATGGEYFSAKNATALGEAMSQIAKKVVEEPKPVVKKPDNNLIIIASEEENGKWIEAVHNTYRVTDGKKERNYMEHCKSLPTKECMERIPVGKYVLKSTYKKLTKETLFEVKSDEVTKLHIVIGSTGKVEISASEKENTEEIKTQHNIYPMTDGKKDRNYIKQCKSKKKEACISQLPVGKYLLISKYKKLKKETLFEVKSGDVTKLRVVMGSTGKVEITASEKENGEWIETKHNIYPVKEGKTERNYIEHCKSKQKKACFEQIPAGKYVLKSKSKSKNLKKETLFEVKSDEITKLHIVMGSTEKTEVKENLKTSDNNELQKGLEALNKKEYDKALQILQPLSDAGDAQAQYALGGMYGQGLGVKRDRAKSMELVKKSANQGNLDAAHRMAMATGFNPMLSDEEVDKVINGTIKLYKEEIAKNNTKAMVYMAGWYESGFSVKQDIDKAINLYKKAAGLGDADAAFKIGRSFYSGNGGTKEEGKVWLEKAAASGHKEAKEFLDDYYTVIKVRDEDVVVSSTIKEEESTPKIPKDPIKAGWKAVTNKDYQTAYKYFSSCVVTSTQTFMGCNMGLSVTSYALGKYDETLKYTARMEKKDPNNQFVTIIKAKAMIKTNDARGAVQVLDTLIKKMENTTWEGHGDMHYYRAEAKQVLGDTKGACEDWAISLDRNKYAGENATPELNEYCSEKSDGTKRAL